MCIEMWDLLPRTTFFPNLALTGCWSLRNSVLWTTSMDSCARALALLTQSRMHSQAEPTPPSNKRPMGIDALPENQLGHLPKFHIYSLSTSGGEIELIFTLGAAVSEIWSNFQNCHIWPWNLAKKPEDGKIYPNYPPPSFLLYGWPRYPIYLQDIGNFAFSHWPHC